MNKYILFGLLMFGFTNQIKSQDSNQTHHCEHGKIHFSTAPISVMGEHMHTKGNFMVSYRSMYMNMLGMIEKSNTISKDNIYEVYMMAPQKMSMQMHMLGLMFSPSSKITIMAMANFTVKKMEIENRMMMTTNGYSHFMYSSFETSSYGMGDLSLTGLINLAHLKNTSIHSNIGVYLPLGNITKTGNTPMADNSPLPYSMQLGSGTIDTKLGLTATGTIGKIDWGCQPKSILRFYDNKMGYRLGNIYSTEIWGAYSVVNWLSFSIKNKTSFTEKIKGKNDLLNPMMSPTTNSNNYGGLITSGSIGVNLYIYNGWFSGTKIAFESSFPLYYNLFGMQMKPSSFINLGIQYLIR